MDEKTAVAIGRIAHHVDELFAALNVLRAVIYPALSARTAEEKRAVLDALDQLSDELSKTDTSEAYKVKALQEIARARRHARS